MAGVAYNFAEHLHRYAVWTAARAAQRGFSISKKNMDNQQKYLFSLNSE
jgi:hypothetical protein